MLLCTMLLIHAQQPLNKNFTARENTKVSLKKLHIQQTVKSQLKESTPKNSFTEENQSVEVLQ